MESYGPIDIFDTKGNEYLFVIGYLIILIIFWRLASKPVKIGKQIKNALRIFNPENLRIPQGVFYCKNHTWTNLDKSGFASVGLDDILSHLTGEIRFNMLRSEGDIIKKGELLTEIEHQGKKLKIVSPVSGEILNTNPLLKDGDAIVNEDPYGSGWIYQIKPEAWVEETKSYYLAEEANSWARKELVKLKDFLAFSTQKYSPEFSNVVLQDGGEMMDSTLSELPEEIWKDFQENFLDEV